MRRKLILSGALTAVVLVICDAGHSQLAGGDFEIRRSTIDAGGGVSSGGGFELRATIGQPDTGQFSGGRFELDGGFWTRSTSDLLFRNSFEEDR